MRKKKKSYFIIAVLFVLLVLVIFLGVNNNRRQLEKATKESLNDTALSTKKSTHQKKESISSSSTNRSVEASNLPDAHQSDWNLILVNKWNKRAELNPPLTLVGGKEVNSKIASEVAAFLEAAQKIDPAEHLISGYRSVTYQNQLYNNYVAQEMAGQGTVNRTGKAISEAQAVLNVNTYSMPPGMSEHNTGLAIDMSTIDSLNDSNPEVVAKIMAIAPNYGFVLHFQKGMSASTGVDYEDWHYRYVGVENAKYMTAHHLSLEEYVALLPK